ncbi:hypothetical protein FB451DRAFT_1568725 [Mycena latifolia]|nr:hypothetical protein FB451DRAFT_1568725 [Mycena latifolia]
MEFTYSARLEPGARDVFSVDAASSSACFSAFTLAPPLRPAVSGSRAQAQARYRAKNQDAERDKARRRMRALCETRREETTLPTAPPASFFSATSTTSRVTAASCTEASTIAGWQRLRFSTGPFDLDDAHFCIRYEAPLPRGQPTVAELEARLADLEAGRTALLLQFDPADVVAQTAFEKLDAAGIGPLDDDDIEFALLHAVPRPTLDSLRRCSCARGAAMTR